MVIYTFILCFFFFEWSFILYYVQLDVNLLYYWFSNSLLFNGTYPQPCFLESPNIVSFLLSLSKTK